jgi:chitinase
MAAKAKFIEEYRLRGFSMWEAGGDYNNRLLDAVRRKSLVRIRV